MLDGLAERELLVAEAKKLGLKVSEEALEADLMEGRVRTSLPAESVAELSFMLGLCPPSNAGYACAPGAEFPVRQVQFRRTPNEPFDYKVYENRVRQMTNRGPKEFKEMQERELLAARMRDIVRSRVRIPDPEAYLLFERDRAKVVVRTVNLKRDWFAKYAVDLDDAPSTSGAWATRRKSTPTGPARKPISRRAAAWPARFSCRCPKTRSTTRSSRCVSRPSKRASGVAKGEAFDARGSRGFAGRHGDAGRRFWAASAIATAWAPMS